MIRSSTGSWRNRLLPTANWQWLPPASRNRAARCVRRAPAICRKSMRRAGCGATSVILHPTSSTFHLAGMSAGKRISSAGWITPLLHRKRTWPGPAYALADLQRLIVGQVAQTTIAARASPSGCRFARDTLAIQDENLQIARWRRQAGLVSSLDVEQARTQRAQTAATIPGYRKRSRQQRERDFNPDRRSARSGVGDLLEDAARIPRAARQLRLCRAGGNPAPPARCPARGNGAAGRHCTDRPCAHAIAAAGAADRQYRHGLYQPFQPVRHHHRRAVRRGQPADLRRRTHAGADRRGARPRRAHSLAGWEQSILRALEDVESAGVSPARRARTRGDLQRSAGRGAAMPPFSRAASTRPG